MKLSTKILIGLVSATLLCVFLGPIIFSGIVRGSMTKMTVACGPIKTVRIASGTSGLPEDYRLLCQIHTGDVNEAVLVAGWPNAAKVDMNYSQTDSTLIISGDLSSGSARVTVTLAEPDLRRLIASGARTSVNISGINVPVLMIDTDDARLRLRGSYVGNMLVKERSSYPSEAIEPSVLINSTSNVDTLFYSIDYGKAIFSNGHVGAMIGLPGSKAVSAGGASGDDEFVVVIGDKDDDSDQGEE